MDDGLGRFGDRRLQEKGAFLLERLSQPDRAVFGCALGSRAGEVRLGRLNGALLGLADAPFLRPHRRQAGETGPARVCVNPVGTSPAIHV